MKFIIVFISAIVLFVGFFVGNIFVIKKYDPPPLNMREAPEIPDSLRKANLRQERADVLVKLDFKDVVLLQLDLEDSLRMYMSKYDSVLAELPGYHSTIDSLTLDIKTRQKKISTLTEHIIEKQAQVDSLQTRGEGLKEISKTYESMKPKELKPIFEKLDDWTIIDIYNNTSKRKRGNIISSLPAARSSRITILMSKGIGAKDSTKR